MADLPLMCHQMQIGIYTTDICEVKMPVRGRDNIEKGIKKIAKVWKLGK
jgi:hypothetical protein